MYTYFTRDILLNRDYFNEYDMKKRETKKISNLFVESLKPSINELENFPSHVQTVNIDLKSDTALLQQEEEWLQKVILQRIEVIRMQKL